METKNAVKPENQLTDEQVEFIAQEMDKAIEGTPTEKIINFPSNQGRETVPEEEREEGEFKSVNVGINPNTGEQVLLASDDSVDEETFDEMCERIKNSEINIDQTPITEKEIISHLATSKTDNTSIINEIASNVDLSNDAVKKLLEIVNRKINKEDFNVYREFPDEIKVLVDKYMRNGQIPLYSNEGKQFRNTISEMLINDFITNITIERTMTDFNKELESIFEKQGSELADTIVGYTEERNKKYREYANQMEDENKKTQILNILDQIDEAYNLTTLIQFSERCKIKKFELEKPQKVFSYFLNKYKDSPYNIYDINMARPILERNLTIIDDSISIKDIDAFFIAFCKQTMNMKPDVVTEHAYMYYLIYNIVIMDLNNGESKHVSDKYAENIIKVIYNLRARNNNFV